MATIKINQVWRRADGSAWRIKGFQLADTPGSYIRAANAEANVDNPDLVLYTDKLDRDTLRTLAILQDIYNPLLLAQIRSGEALLIS